MDNGRHKTNPAAEAAVASRRDSAIDALRALALGFLVLAHSGVGGWLFNLRAFDVTCMAMISAMSFALTRSKPRPGRSLWKYVGARVRRLLVPTYGFLCAYFALVGLIQWCGWTDSPAFRGLSWSRAANAFLLGNGITWIVRVYVLLAFANPFIAKFSGAVRSHALYLGAVALCVPVQCLALRLVPASGPVSPAGWFYREFVLYLGGYCIVALLGCRHAALSRRARLGVAGIAVAGLALVWLKNGFLPFQDFKYPPHPYYLAYGVAATLFLYEAFSLPVLRPVASNRFVLWASRNSLWIFFWHFIGVELLADFSFPAPFARFWALRWAFNMGTGLLLTALHNLVREIWRRCRASQSCPAKGNAGCNPEGGQGK